MAARFNHRNRKGLAQRTNTVPSSAPAPPFNVHQTPSELLRLILRDARVGVSQFRRLAMCAGATPAEFFDPETGKAHLTKGAILREIIRTNRDVTYAPKFASVVTHWLGEARINIRLLAAAVNGARMKKREPMTASRRDERSSPHTSSSVLPSADGVVHSGTGTMPKVIGVLAALYIVLRSVFANGTGSRHRRILRFLLAQPAGSDVPYETVRRKARASRGRSVAGRTYASTGSCLQHVYDTRLHDAFVRHTTLPTIRKALLGLRKPWFFGGRTLLNLHLLRRTGELRTSPAEIAYALRTEYTSADVFDAAISYSEATLASMYTGMETAFRRGVDTAVSGGGAQRRWVGRRTRARTRVRAARTIRRRSAR